MTNSHSFIKRSFVDLGLSVIRDEGSDLSFENFVVEACGPAFCIRGIRDRKSESVELRARVDSAEWFDLSIVRTFMLGESKLFDEGTLGDQMSFVKSHFDELSRLFGEPNYPNLEPRLKELELHRAKIRFPEWYE